LPSRVTRGRTHLPLPLHLVPDLRLCLYTTAPLPRRYAVILRTPHAPACTRYVCVRTFANAHFVPLHFLFPPYLGCYILDLAFTCVSVRCFVRYLSFCVCILHHVAFTFTFARLRRLMPRLYTPPHFCHMRLDLCTFVAFHMHTFCCHFTRFAHTFITFVVRVLYTHTVVAGPLFLYLIYFLRVYDLPATRCFALFVFTYSALPCPRSTTFTICTHIYTPRTYPHLLPDDWRCYCYYILPRIAAPSWFILRILRLHTFYLRFLDVLPRSPFHFGLHRICVGYLCAHTPLPPFYALPCRTVRAGSLVTVTFDCLGSPLLALLHFVCRTRILRRLLFFGLLLRYPRLRLLFTAPRLLWRFTAYATYCACSRLLLPFPAAPATLTRCLILGILRCGPTHCRYRFARFASLRFGTTGLRAHAFCSLHDYAYSRCICCPRLPNTYTTRYVYYAVCILAVSFTLPLPCVICGTTSFAHVDVPSTVSPRCVTFCHTRTHAHCNFT